ncbi:MAG: hypothetical protein IKF14_18535 [Atopobiaceae bacterium]|nr:hypothetical protein [Atopobiaceae bacterium]MBR3161088.1 hypothetical protein [Atopobiaceae bacterium]
MTVRINTKEAPRYAFWVDDKEYRIPAMGSLPLPFLRKYAKGDPSDMNLAIDFLLDILAMQAEDADGNKVEGLADTLGSEAVMAIFADYTAGSTEDLGESSASSE